MLTVRFETGYAAASGMQDTSVYECTKVITTAGEVRCYFNDIEYVMENENTYHKAYVMNESGATVATYEGHAPKYGGGEPLKLNQKPDDAEPEKTD